MLSSDGAWWGYAGPWLGPGPEPAVSVEQGHVRTVLTGGAVLRKVRGRHIRIVCYHVPIGCTQQNLVSCVSVLYSAFRISVIFKSVHPKENNSHSDFEMLTKQPFQTKVSIRSPSSLNGLFQPSIKPLKMHLCFIKVRTYIFLNVKNAFMAWMHQQVYTFACRDLKMCHFSLSAHSSALRLQVGLAEVYLLRHLLT